MAQQRRLLYLDEDVPKRLSPELKARGRNVLSIYTDRRTGTLDPDLITMLAARFGDAVVLVTANESMPIDHAEVLQSSGLTLAVIDGDHDMPQDSWRRETVHRWAHLMENQERGTWRRYSPYRQGAWRRRRRRPRLQVD